MKRAALYLRVSTEEQTTANQYPELRRIAKVRDFKIVKQYTETESAAKRRPEFDAMMQAAHRGEFDVVIVWALDRFGRSMVGNLEAVKALDDRGVTLISARESWLDTTGPHRTLLVGIFSWVAEQERARLIERTVAGMARARAEGKQIGRPQVNAPRGIVLSLAESGLSQRKIARRLKVSQASVSRVLSQARAQAPAVARSGSSVVSLCRKCGAGMGLLSNGKRPDALCTQCANPAAVDDAKGASRSTDANPAKSRHRAG